MRRDMHEADIDRKTLIQKIADFLQKVLPNSNAHPEQMMVTSRSPPSESADARGADLKSEAPASHSGTAFLSREYESLFESPIKRSLSTDSEDEGLPVMSRANRR